MKLWIFWMIGMFAGLASSGQTITTVIGTGYIFDGDGKAALQAPLGLTMSIAVHPTTNEPYFVDTDNHMVMRVGAGGILFVAAGNGRSGFSGDGGPAKEASLNTPRQITFDRAGNLYIADMANQRVRRVDTVGVITTVAGNGNLGRAAEGAAAANAPLNYPHGVAVDSRGNLYIADHLDNKKRKLTRKGSEHGSDARPLRADALRNVDSLLGAAMVVFEASGVDAPIREIADKAGVGVGTVYRHFPQRSDLIVAVLKTQIDSCADAAEDIAGKYEPGKALARWMQRYVDLIGKKRGFAGALHSGDSAYSALSTYFFKRMEPALEKLLDAAIAAKAIRGGVRADDLLRAVATLCHGPHGEEPSYARSMVQLLIDGMGCGTSDPTKSKAVRKS